MRKLLNIRAFALAFLAFALLLPAEAGACTSVIVSGRATASGKPLLLKVRDNTVTEETTTFQYFHGEKYDFLGNIADAAKAHDKIRSTVGGYNTAGLCLASLTSHGFPLDSVKKGRISGGGLLYRALGSCRNLAEFEKLARQLQKEHVIITNVGGIDADGAAAYYEFGGHSFTKYDVNSRKDAPQGFRAMTNFAFSGDTTKGGGIERYDDAMECLARLPKDRNGKIVIDHTHILDTVVRSLCHHRKGIRDIDGLKDEQYYPFDGFICRFTTNAAYVFEGVKRGEDPKHTVLWACIGNPCCTPALPLVLGDSNMLPECIYAGDRIPSSVCLRARGMRETHIFDRSKMMNVANIRAMLPMVRGVEEPIRQNFTAIHDAWTAGKMTDAEFYAAYRKLTPAYYDSYVKGTAAFSPRVWVDPLKAGAQVHGQGWAELRGTYSRLPERAKGMVRQKVWNLSRNSAGLSLVFRSNAANIKVRYGVSGSQAMFHMPSTGVSGIDLYATDLQGVRRWCAPDFTPSFRDTITYTYSNLTYFPKNRARYYEYHLYLPLYTSVKWLEIGVPEGAMLEFCPETQERPIVVYGTSIAQGACASRPGMCWTGIVERELEHPLVNLGFSGNGKLEPEVFTLMSGIDASLYIIDCMPNMREADPVVKLVTEGVRILRSKHDCPILLVEHSGYVNEVTNESRSYYRHLNDSLASAFAALKAAGYNDIHYLSCDEIALGMDGMVEGVHPNDLGMYRYACAYEKKIREIFHESFDSCTPCTNDRDSYIWKTRHEQVLGYVSSSKPQVVLIGDSILHFWGGEPAFPQICRGADSWEELWQGRRVANLGFGWDRVENMLWRITHGELDGYSAEDVYIMAGTNNLAVKWTPEHIAQGVMEIAHAVRERQPQARIHVCGLAPRGDADFDIPAVNAAIREALSADSALSGVANYVDMSRLMVGPDGGIINSLYVDRLHPNADGYRAFAKMLKEAK